MGIRTKFNPMGGKNGKKYKAYIVSGSEATDVVHFGFTEDIDPDKTFGAEDGAGNCKWIILNGKVYKYSYNSSVSSSTLTRYSRYSSYDDCVAVSGNYSVLIIRQNGTVLNETTTLPYITDAVKLYNTYDKGSSPDFPFIITESGKLYYRNKKGYVVNLISGVNFLSGSMKLTNRYYYYGTDTGIASIFLTFNSSTHDISVTQNDVNINYGVPKTIKGFAGTSSGSYAYMINTQGHLYAIQWTSNSLGAKLIDSSKNFQYLSCGQDVDTPGVALAIADNNLYQIRGSTLTLIDNTKNWTFVSGMASSGVYSYGIADGDLYFIKNFSSSATPVLKKCIKFYGQQSVECPMLAVCEV